MFKHLSICIQRQQIEMRFVMKLREYILAVHGVTHSKTLNVRIDLHRTVIFASSVTGCELKLENKVFGDLFGPMKD